MGNLRIVRLSSSCVMSVICRKMALQIVESCNPGLENMEKVWRIWRTWKRAFIATVENHKILAWRTSWVSSRLAKIKRNVEPYDYMGLHLWDFFLAQNWYLIVCDWSQRITSFFPKKVPQTRTKGTFELC